METLAIITKALLDKGLDYEVTLNMSNVRVRLFDSKTDATLGIDTSDSLERALSGVLANIASNVNTKYLTENVK